VAVSEGLRYPDGTFVTESKISTTDGFGHVQLGGLAGTLAGLMKMRTGAKVRGIELSLLQRCAAHLASQTDIDEAFKVGQFAVQAAVAGETGKMAAFQRQPGPEYRCDLILQPLEIVANVEKTVPREWINEEGNNVTQDFLDYVLPLVQGEPQRVLEQGMPRFAKLRKIRATP